MLPDDVWCLVVLCASDRALLTIRAVDRMRRRLVDAHLSRRIPYATRRYLRSLLVRRRTVGGDLPTRWLLRFNCGSVARPLPQYVCGRCGQSVASLLDDEHVCRRRRGFVRHALLPTAVACAATVVVAHVATRTLLP